ncbi:MAG: threonine synthase [Pseudomonadota bacterium]|jgi:threonine synthase|nr:MAG: threonine synthase [Pseudomonadota bacterium]
MKFHSTRGRSPEVSFSEALLAGLAPDGGLYVPGQWPELPHLAPAPLPELGRALIGAFAADDALAAELPAITADAFNFPAPLKPLGDSGRLAVLELFHGPTAAFKDFGARFLAAALERIPRPGGRPLRILVATSGDTGGAVAAAFHRRPGIEVVVLFPKGLVSPTQQQQLTCWGDNVTSLAVRGSFDDCQRLVKEAFVDPDMRARAQMSSANSINLGRLLPQAVYYAASSLEVLARTGRKASYIIPSGNLGNAAACVWARRMGLPIDRIVLAHNANLTVPEFLQSGQLRPRPSVATLASAMDVGNPSNLERLLDMFPAPGELAGQVSADWVDDEAIRARIRTDFAALGETWCPHTATAAEVYARLPAAEREGRHWVLVATAHPAKFREIVEPLVGKVTVPDNLKRLYDLPSHFTEINPTLSDLAHAVGG